jgi:branched-chain amino acid transport system permease protein
MVVAAGLALVVGLVSLRLRGVYFALFTLAVAEMFHIYFQRLQFTGSEDGFELRGLPDWLNPTRQHLQFYYIAMVLAVASFVFVRRLMHSPTGAILLGIRENEERAKTIGYNTLGYKLFAITTAGVLAAVAGIMQAMFNKKVGPEMMGLAYTVDPLIATIIGGIGTFAGPVIGASALHLSDRQLRDAVLTIGGVKINIGQDWELILGAAFIVVVIVFPYGIVGTWQRLFPNGVIDRIQRLFHRQTDSTDPKQAAPEHT